MHSRAWAVAVVMLFAAPGCVYKALSLGREPAVPAKNDPAEADADEKAAPPKGGLPATVGEEVRRRRRRSKWAALAAPLELAGGGLLAYLALYAPAAPSDADSVVGVLEDSAEQALGRAMLGSAGIVTMLSGVADLILAGASYALPSPFIVGRDGRRHMLSIDEIYREPPTRVPHLDVSTVGVLGGRGPGYEADIGVAHWVSSRTRLRYGIGGGTELVGFDWGRIDPPVDGDERASFFGIASASARADIAFGRRRYWGRYPGLAFSLFGSARAAWSEAGRRHLGWRFAVGVSSNRGTIFLGASQLRGRDRYPVPELLYQIELAMD